MDRTVRRKRGIDMATLTQILEPLDMDTPFWIQDPNDEMWAERFEDITDAILSDFGGFDLNGKVLWMGICNGDDGGELVIEMKH